MCSRSRGMISDEWYVILLGRSWSCQYMYVSICRSGVLESVGVMIEIEIGFLTLQSQVSWR